MEVEEKEIEEAEEEKEERQTKKREVEARSCPRGTREETNHSSLASSIALEYSGCALRQVMQEDERNELILDRETERARPTLIVVDPIAV